MLVLMLVLVDVGACMMLVLVDDVVDDVVGDVVDFISLSLTKGCESELTPPDESSHRSNRNCSKTATTPARYLGRRSGFSCG